MPRNHAADEEDTGETPLPVFKERRSNHWRIQEIGVLLMMVVQLAGLIWGAATLKSGVDNMKLVVDRLDKRVEDVNERQRLQEIQAAEQKGRLAAIQDLVFDLKSKAPTR